MSTNRAMKISPPGIALLCPACLPVHFQAPLYVLKMFCHAWLPFLGSRLRGDDAVECNDAVVGVKLLRMHSTFGRQLSGRYAFDVRENRKKGPPVRRGRGSPCSGFRLDGEEKPISGAIRT